MDRFVGSIYISIHPRSMGFGNTPVGLKFISTLTLILSSRGEERVRDDNEKVFLIDI